VVGSLTCTLAVVVALAVTGCGRSSGPPREPPLDELEAALEPAAMAKALLRAGGGHYHALTTLQIDTPVPGQPALRDAVTTTTDLWLDKLGHYRLLETNDRDGGREVIKHGKDLAVALRYSRMIRRPVQEPEATRFLTEALGGPAAAWEVARRFAQVSRKDEGKSSAYEVKKAEEPQSVKADFESGSPLQKWRETVNVESLSGQARLEGTTLVPLSSRFEVKFTLARDGVPMSGLVRVEAALDGVGQTPPVEPPHADELSTRQRTILEERALLGRTNAPEGAQR
jgi:hypothetical protein